MTMVISEARGCPDADALMEMASAQTGLNDFGDERLRVPLDALMYSFRHDAWPNMTPNSREVTAAWLVDRLVNRLRVKADRKRYPKIADVEINSPFIIMGPPRTGSTLLHTLLSMDPNNIAPPQWLVDEPSPPPGLGEPTAERLEESNRKLLGIANLIPDIFVQHAYMIEEGSSMVSECSGMLEHAFTTLVYYYYWSVPSYREYLFSADHTAAMGYHHDFLQHSQLGREDKRWALKGADHMVWLRYLAARYPDAKLLWTHRDLSQFLSSDCSVMRVCRGVGQPVPADAWRALGQETVELERRKFESAMQARDAIGEDRFCDVSYHDVMANPVRAVERIYERFGMELSPEASKNILTWVENNNQTKHGVHQHSPSDFGLDGDAINRQFRNYTDRFGFGFGIRPEVAV